MQNSLGFNFGSANLENMLQPNESSELKRSHITEMQRILLFDLMTLNPDRTPSKVNLLSDNDHIYAIDHELAFSAIPFLFPARRNPWELNQGDIQQIKGGIISKLIMGRQFIQDPFVSDIRSITPAFWDKALSHLPDEWQWEHWHTVRSFINDIVAHADEFVYNVKRTLL